MRLSHLLPGAGLLLILSCQESAPVQDRATGHLTFRVGCEEGAPDAISEEFEGRTYWFGPKEDFELQYAGVTLDVAGRPAIAFEVEEQLKPAFKDMTTRCINRPLAIYVGDQLICAPTVFSTLPGQGIIMGGQTGFSDEERDRLLKTLRGT